MSFDGAGTFNINSSGQPPVSATAITVAAHTALTADLATGLSTCITKDGQTVTTAAIAFAAGATIAGGLGVDEVFSTTTNAGTLNAAAITNNTGLAANPFTATLTAVTNVDSSSAGVAYYVRVGNFVFAAGQLIIDPTAAGATATELDIDLPVASNLAATGDLIGCCQSVDSAIVELGYITPDTTLNRAKMQFKSASAASHGMGFWFFYTVI